MASRRSWAGWIFFAGVLMVVIGVLNFVQGLIAIIRDDYYDLTPEADHSSSTSKLGVDHLIVAPLSRGSAALVPSRSGHDGGDRSPSVSASIFQLASSAASIPRSGRSPFLALNVLVLYALTCAGETWGV